MKGQKSPQKRINGNVVSHVYKGERNIQQYFVTATSHFKTSFLHSTSCQNPLAFQFSQPLPTPVGYPVSIPPPPPLGQPLSTQPSFFFPSLLPFPIILTLNYNYSLLDFCANQLYKLTKIYKICVISTKIPLID